MKGTGGYEARVYVHIFVQIHPFELARRDKISKQWNYRIANKGHSTTTSITSTLNHREDALVVLFQALEGLLKLLQTILIFQLR